MSQVHEFLQKMVQRQISEAGIVVWYDPEGFYKEIVHQLDLPGASVCCYDNSFFALRREIETLLDQSEPPKLLIYVPLAQEETHHALIEAEAAGIVIKPGAVPKTCNTRPAYVARQALQPLLGEAAVQAIERQVEEAKLSLVDLEKLAEQGGGLSNGVVSLIFGTGSPQDVALAFLSSDVHDEELIAKEAMPELITLLQTVYEYHPTIQMKPAEYRKALTRFILLSELLFRLPAPLPEVLTTAPAAVKPTAREDCSTLANIWRNRRDISESYISPANQIEIDLRLKDLFFTLDQLKSVETFLEMERQLSKEITNAIIENIQESLVIFAEM